MANEISKEIVYPVVVTEPVLPHTAAAYSNTTTDVKSLLFPIGRETFPFVTKFTTVAFDESETSGESLLRNITYAIIGDRVYISWGQSSSVKYVEVYYLTTSGGVVKKVHTSDTFLTFGDSVVEGDRWDVFLVPVDYHNKLCRLAENAFSMLVKKGITRTDDLYIVDYALTDSDSLRLVKETTLKTDSTYYIPEFKFILIGQDLYVTWSVPDFVSTPELKSYTVEYNYTQGLQTNSTVVENIPEKQQYVRIHEVVVAPFSFDVAIFVNLKDGSRNLVATGNILRCYSKLVDNSSALKRQLGYTAPSESWASFVPEYLRDGDSNVVSEVNALLYNIAPDVDSVLVPSRYDLIEHFNTLDTDARNILSTIQDPYFYKDFFAFKATPDFYSLILKYFGIDAVQQQVNCVANTSCPNIVDLRVKECPSPQVLAAFIRVLRASMPITVKLVAVSNVVRPTTFVMDCSKLSFDLFSNYVGTDIAGVLFYCQDARKLDIDLTQDVNVLPLHSSIRNGFYKYSYSSLLNQYKFGDYFRNFSYPMSRWAIRSSLLKYISGFDRIWGEGDAWLEKDTWSDPINGKWTCVSIFGTTLDEFLLSGGNSPRGATFAFNGLEPLPVHVKQTFASLLSAKLPARKRRITLPRKFFDGTVPFDLPIDTAPAPKSHVQSSSDQYKYAYTELLGQFKFGDAKKDKAFSPSFLTAEKSEFLNYAQLKMSAYTWQKDLSWVSDLDWTPTNKVTLRKQFKFSVQLSEYGKLSGVAGTKGEVSGFVGVKKVTPKAGTEKNLSFLDEKVRFVENSSLDQFSTSKSVAVPLDSVAASKGGSKFNSKLTVVKCFIPDGNLSTFILGSRFKGVGASRGIQTQMYGGVCRESYSFSSVAISALNAYTFRMSDMPFADTNPYGMIYGFVGITTHLGFRREFANERIPVPVLDKEVSVRSAKSSSNSSLYKYLGFDRKYLGVTKLSGEHRSLLSSVSTAERSFCVSSVVAKSFPETWEAGFAWSSDQAWEYLGTSGVRTVFYEGIPRLSETSLSDSNFAFNAVTVMPHKGFSVLSKPLRRETRKGVGWQAVRDNVSMGLSVGVGSRYTSLPN